MAYCIVALEYKHEVVVDDDEPSRYIKRLEGHVVKNYGYRKERVGRFQIFVIDVELAFNDGYPVFQVFDYHSETAEYWSLYKAGLEFKTKVTRVLAGGERWHPNMLILDRMEILPAHRGAGVGLRALRCLQRQYSMGCGVVAMRPFPLQFEGGSPEVNKDRPAFVRLGLGTLDADFKRATARLRAYYSCLGFARVAGTDIMVADPMVLMPMLDAA